MEEEGTLPDSWYQCAFLVPTLTKASNQEARTLRPAPGTSRHGSAQPNLGTAHGHVSLITNIPG